MLPSFEILSKTTAKEITEIQFKIANNFMLENAFVVQFCHLIDHFQQSKLSNLLYKWKSPSLQYDTRYHT